MRSSLLNNLCNGDNDQNHSFFFAFTNSVNRVKDKQKQVAVLFKNL